jgi:hypothetical protein
MDAATWQMISIIGYSLSAVLFIVVIIMFFKMNIPAIYGYLTGKTAEKHIQAIREQSSKTKGRRYEPIPYNRELDLTEPIPKSKRLWKTGKMRKTGPIGDSRPFSKRLTGSMSVSGKLENIATQSKPVVTFNDLDKTELLVDETELLVNETEVLTDETELLVYGTQVLTDETELLVDETQVLDDTTQLLEEEEGTRTTKLGDTDELYPEERPVKPKISFHVIKDMTITHAAETIKDEEVRS